MRLLFPDIQPAKLLLFKTMKAPFAQKLYLIIETHGIFSFTNDIVNNEPVGSTIRNSCLMEQRAQIRARARVKNLLLPLPL